MCQESGKRFSPPGQHGQRRRKYSEFGLQLEEKQKLRFHYGIREEQFRRFIRVDISSQIIKVGDIVSLTAEAYQNQVYLQAQQSPRLPLPAHMVKKTANGLESGRLIDEPKIDAVPFAFDPGLVISYYSLRG